MCGHRNTWSNLQLYETCIVCRAAGTASGAEAQEIAIHGSIYVAGKDYLRTLLPEVGISGSDK